MVNKFKNDLKMGQLFEKKAKYYFSYDKIKYIEGYFKEYDVIFTKDNKEIKVEVKGTTFIIEIEGGTKMKIEQSAVSLELSQQYK